VDASPLTWERAEKLSYVVDGHKRRVMGASILAYSEAKTAEAIAAKHGGRVLKFIDLRLLLGAGKK
jgi:nitrous oxide reductase accessory protein NosL